MQVFWENIWTFCEGILQNLKDFNHNRIHPAGLKLVDATVAPMFIKTRKQFFIE